MHFSKSKLEIAKENRLLFDDKLPDKAPTTAPGTAPGATKPPEAEVKAAEVKGGASADRKGASAKTAEEAARVGGAPAAAPGVAPAATPTADKPAEGKEQPVAGAEDLPDNEWSQAFYNLKDQLTANPAMQGPLSTLALAVLRLAAKYSNYADLMPGSFRRKIWDSPEYIGKALSNVQAKQVLDRAKKTDGEKEEMDKAAGDLKRQEDELIKAGRKLGKERASTRFVNNTLLGGITGIDDATSLAASLIHTKREVGEGKDPQYLYYSSGKNLDRLKNEPVAKGTILIFVPDMSTGEKVVAYATDEKGNFAYYNVGKKVDGKDVDKKDVTGVRNFTLSEADCPVKQLGLLAVLEPNFEKFAAAPETPPTVPEKPAETSVKLTPVEAVRKFATDTGAKNKSVASEIARYKISPVVWDVNKIKANAADNIAFIEKRTLELEPTVDGLNVEQFRIKETEAKQKLDAATAEADKQVLQQALNKATENLKQAEQVQVYWKEVQALLADAKANKEAAVALK